LPDATEGGGPSERRILNGAATLMSLVLAGERFVATACSSSSHEERVTRVLDGPETASYTPSNSIGSLRGRVSFVGDGAIPDRR
jgi:hypothetical protein